MQVETVLGPLPAKELGVTLIHEHVVCDFGGADVAGPHRCNPDEVVEVMRPFLEALKKSGGDTLVDCSPSNLGRHVGVLRILSEQTGVNIITNTGYYKEPHLSRAAMEATVDELSAIWIREATEGIDDTGIKPGLIKVAVDEGRLSDMHERLVRAAARTHLATGLTIVAHTGDGPAALHQLDILAEEGVAPNAFIWAHADSQDPTPPRLEAAQRGSWIELDGIGFTEYSRQIEMLRELLETGFEKQILLSQDAGWYTIGAPRGGEPRAYEKLLTEFLPQAEKSGIAKEVLQRLVTDNPQRALIPEVRRI